ncbi:MAG: menaquinone biosynthesis protein [bacterium]|nr:menaquinone biosynthesis protein [bacterium]
MFRVASVPFLNAEPLVAKLKSAPATRVDLVRALPSALPALMAPGNVDAALMPVVEHFRLAGSSLVPGCCIATRGEVASVRLFSRVPREELTRIAVDSGSRTSVALLRILLGEIDGTRPEFVVSNADPNRLFGEAEAQLIIGDRCLEAEAWLTYSGCEGVFRHDLGTMWTDLTGLPFVFAAWTLSPQVCAGPRDRLLDLIRLLQDSYRRGMVALKSIAREAAAAGMKGYAGESTPAAVQRYLTCSIKYGMGDEELAGLRRFHDYCRKWYLVPNSSRLALYPTPTESSTGVQHGGFV